MTKKRLEMKRIRIKIEISKTKWTNMNLQGKREKRNRKNGRK